MLVDCENMTEQGRQPKRTVYSTIYCWLEHHALRSRWQVIGHIGIGVALAIGAHFSLQWRASLYPGDFVTLALSLGALSGLFLAVTVALASFWAQLSTTLRETYLDRLTRDRMRLEALMNRAAGVFPDIPRAMTDLYLRALMYQPGERVDQDALTTLYRQYGAWSSQLVKTSIGKFDFGDPLSFDTPARCMLDSMGCAAAVYHDLTMLGINERDGEPLMSFPYLVWSWAATMALALLPALSIAAMSGYVFSIALLLTPAYLFMWAVFALVLDAAAVFRATRNLEVGTQKGIQEWLVSAGQAGSEAGQAGSEAGQANADQ